MHLKAWTLHHKEQVDLAGANMRLIVRIVDSDKQQPAAEDIDAYDHHQRRSNTCCSIDNFIFGTDHARSTDHARKIVRDLLFSVTSFKEDAYEWSATLPLLEVELFHFSYQAAEDYIKATRYEYYGGIQVLADISRPPFKKQKLEIRHENNCCELLVESVGDNFELLGRVDDDDDDDDDEIESTADSKYIPKDGGICKYSIRVNPS